MPLRSSSPCALRHLRELLDDALAFEPGKVIYEQDAVEMIDLVLQARGE